MADKTHLEESLEFLINEETDQAVAAFHKFIVGSARDIHESLMEDDEIDEEVDSEEKVDEAKEKEVDESKDEEEVTEAKEKEVDESKDEEKVEEGMNEYFGGTDLGEVEDDLGIGDDELGGDDMGMEAEETVEVSIDDTMGDLVTKFEAIMGGDEEMAGDELGGLDGDVAENRFTPEANPFAEGKEKDEEAVEEAVSHGDGVQGAQGGAGTDSTGGGTHGKNTSIAHNTDVGKNDDSKLGESEAYDFDLTAEDFLDLEEGLKAVTVTMGNEQGGVKFAGEETNTKSVVADKDSSKLLGTGSKDMISKQDEHGTYKRESAPSNDKLPHSNENNHDKADQTPGRSSVAGHGGLESNSKQGGEQGKKKFAGTETNTKSIIGSAGSRVDK